MNKLSAMHLSAQIAFDVGRLIESAGVNIMHWMLEF